MKYHLVECPDCDGAGETADGHMNDPNARVFKCALCDGEGDIPHDGSVLDCSDPACYSNAIDSVEELPC
jgi:DnaJ-class molecular chaperone